MTEYNNQNNPQNNDQNAWQVDNNTTYHYSYQNPQPSQTPHQHVYTQPKKKKASGKYAIAAVMMALCMVLSAGFGFGGAYAANLLTKEDTAQSEQAENFDQNDSSSIITESDRDDTTSSEATYTYDDGKQLSTVEVVKKAAGSVVEIVTETVSRDSMFGQYVTSGAWRKSAFYFQYSVCEF